MPPAEGPILALVGRSNVGKSTLVNALARRRVARAGARPGTTRVLNVYRLRLAPATAGPKILILVDLPGYGYARGGDRAAQSFERLTRAFFDEVASAGLAGVLLVVDARHPGLESDRAAQAWLADRGAPVLIVATKIDRLARADRTRALRDHGAALGRAAVLPVSAKTGEGMDALWKEIASLLMHRHGRQKPSPNQSSSSPRSKT